MRIRPKFYYMASLLFVFVIPSSVAAYFTLDRIPTNNLLTFIIGMLVLGALWDIWATRHSRKDRVWLWQFNPKNTIGLKLFDLPIEEYLFYVFSSIYVVFIWEAIKVAIDSKSAVMFTLLPFLGIWSMTFITIPYLFRRKRN